MNTLLPVHVFPVIYFLTFCVRICPLVCQANAISIKKIHTEAIFKHFILTLYSAVYWSYSKYTKKTTKKLFRLSDSNRGLVHSRIYPIWCEILMNTRNIKKKKKDKDNREYIWLGNYFSPYLPNRTAIFNSNLKPETRIGGGAWPFILELRV